MADGSVAYGSLPFKQQIAFFRAKVNVPTERWTDLWEAEHDHAFMVAGANRIDLLADLRAAVDKAIADGTGLEAFRRDFDAIVAKYGWAYNGGRNWRTRVIFETNMRTSYAAGRYAQLQALKAVRPFWRYRHSDSVQHPRPEHLAWDGLVLHADDPWWDTHFPPNGWGCQCTVEALNARDLARLGKTGPDAAPASGMRQVIVGKTGPAPFTVDVPDGVDPGFGYAPGKSAYKSGQEAAPTSAPPQDPIPAVLEQLAQDILTKATRLPALAGAEALEPLLALPRAEAALDAIAAAPATGASTVQLGALEVDLVRGLADLGVTPATAPIASDAATLPVGVPAVLRAPQAVLLDPAAGELLYVAPASAGADQLRLVVIRLASTAGQANVYAGDRSVTLAQLQAQVAAGTVRPLKGTR